jgi:hypothetical protein
MIVRRAELLFAIESSSADNVAVAVAPNAFRLRDATGIPPVTDRINRFLHTVRPDDRGNYVKRITEKSIAPSCLHRRFRFAMIKTPHSMTETPKKPEAAFNGVYEVWLCSACEG